MQSLNTLVYMKDSIILFQLFKLFSSYFYYIFYYTMEYKTMHIFFHTKPIFKHLFDFMSDKPEIVY